jgi:hypothetical protein
MDLREACLVHVGQHDLPRCGQGSEPRQLDLCQSERNFIPFF